MRSLTFCSLLICSFAVQAETTTKIPLSLSEMESYPAHVLGFYSGYLPEIDRDLYPKNWNALATACTNR